MTSGQTITHNAPHRCRWRSFQSSVQILPELVPDLIWADQFLLDAPTERGVLHFHYDERYGGGYHWVFPAKVGSRVGFPKGTDPVPPDHLERHRRAIPVAKAERLVNGRCCLVGDAACQVNAISFGGIRTAMVAGRMAAEAIARGDLSSYERHWSSSPYAKASDMGTHARLSSMSNQEMTRMTEPFRDGYGSLRALKAMLFSSDREIYTIILVIGKIWMVRRMNYDVLIVGAGPAGSAAAACSAKAGARTLLVDRKKEIGTPVQCGEVVSASLLAQSGLRLPPGVALWSRAIPVSSWTGDGSLTIGPLLERGHRGTEDLRQVPCAGSGTNGCFCPSGLPPHLHGDGWEHSEEGPDKDARGGRGVEPKMVVAADGVHSTVGKLMGRPGFDRTDLATGVEFEMVSKRKLPRCMQIFIEPEIGLGYGWIIPKGEWRANVGFGQVGRRLSRRDALLDWITGHPVVSSYFDDRSILEVKTGDAPVPDFKGGP